MLNSRKAAQAKFGRMLRWHALAFDTNRGWNPGIMLQPARGQRNWPAALKLLSSLLSSLPDGMRSTLTPTGVRIRGSCFNPLPVSVIGQPPATKRREQIGSAQMVLSGDVEMNLRRLSSLLRRLSSLPSLPRSPQDDQNKARPREAAKARPREAAQRKSRFTVEPRITRITLIIA